MIAFALSGGGNRGALQVGALQVLLERGVKPDLVVGTSAGALNAAFLASNPTPEGTRRLARIWEHVSKDDIYPGVYGLVLWRLVCNCASLYSNANFERFVRGCLRAAHLRVFGDIAMGIRLYIVAAHLGTGAEKVFGDNASDSILDAIMSSTALPPFHPPWRCNGELYVDGGLAANLPMRIAAERGAREIFALHVAGVVQRDLPLRGVLDISGRALGALGERQVQSDLQAVTDLPNVELHYVPLTAYAHLPMWDFRHTTEMIAEGRAAMQTYLDALPRVEAKKEHTWLRMVRRQRNRVRRAFERWRKVSPRVAPNEVTP